MSASVLSYADRLPKTRAMPGVCPIRLGMCPGMSPSTFEVIEWFHAVRGWGLANNQFVTKVGIIQWMGSIVDDTEEAERIRLVIESIAPDDDESLRLLPQLSQPQAQMG